MPGDARRPTALGSIAVTVDTPPCHGVTPTLSWVFGWAALAGASRCYTTFSKVSSAIAGTAIGAGLALSFWGFGTPLPLAVFLGAPVCVILAANSFTMPGLVHSGVFARLYEFCAQDFEAAAKKHVGGIAVSWIINLAVFGPLLYFGTWANIYADPETSPSLSLACIVVTTLFSVGMCLPNGLMMNCAINVCLSVMPVVLNGIVDSYAHALVRTLLDERLDPRAKLAKVDVLHRNFNALLSSTSLPKRWHVGNFVAQFAMVLGVVASVACVVVNIQDEESSTGRVAVGTFMTLLIGGYLIAVMNTVVGPSAHWERVCLAQLGNPRVTGKALELGAWRTSLDFKAWLRENHDLRDYFLGMLSDHRRLGQLASVLGSGLAVVMGYGTLSLVGLR